jgi:hypothetical protein
MKKPECRKGSSCGYACIEKTDVCLILFGPTVNNLLDIKSRIRSYAPEGIKNNNSGDDDDLKFLLQQRYRKEDADRIIELVEKNTDKYGNFKETSFKKAFEKEKFRDKSTYNKSTFENLSKGWSELEKYLKPRLNSNNPVIREKAEEMVKMALGTLVPQVARNEIGAIDRKTFDALSEDRDFASRYDFLSRVGTRARSSFPVGLNPDTKSRPYAIFEILAKEVYKDPPQVTTAFMLGDDAVTKVDLSSYIIRDLGVNKRPGVPGMYGPTDKEISGLKKILPYANLWTDREIDLFMSLIPKESLNRGHNYNVGLKYGEEEWFEALGIEEGHPLRSKKYNRDRLMVKRYMEQLGRDPVLGIFVPFQHTEWDHIYPASKNKFADHPELMFATSLVTNRIKSDKTYGQAFYNLAKETGALSFKKKPWVSKTNKTREEYEKSISKKTSKEEKWRLANNYIRKALANKDLYGAMEVVDGIIKNFDNVWDGTGTGRNYPFSRYLLDSVLKTFKIRDAGTQVRGINSFGPSKSKPLQVRVHYPLSGVEINRIPGNKYLLTKLLQLSFYSGENKESVVKNLAELFKKGGGISKKLDIKRPKLEDGEWGFINIKNEAVVGKKKADIQEKYERDIILRKEAIAEEIEKIFSALQQ